MMMKMFFSHYIKVSRANNFELATPDATKTPTATQITKFMINNLSAKIATNPSRCCVFWGLAA